MRGNKATGPSSRLCGMIMRSFICWDKSVPEAQAKGSFLLASHHIPFPGSHQASPSAHLLHLALQASPAGRYSPLLQHYQLKGN